MNCYKSILLLFLVLHAYSSNATPDEVFNSMAARRCLRKFHQQNLSVETQVSLIDQYKKIASEYFEGQNCSIELQSDDYTSNNSLHETSYSWQIIKNCPEGESSVLANFTFHCPDDLISSQSGSSDSNCISIDQQGRLHQFRSYLIETYKPAYAKRNTGFYNSLSTNNSRFLAPNEWFCSIPDLRQLELDTVYQIEDEESRNNRLVSFSENNLRINCYDLKTLRIKKLNNSSNINPSLTCFIGTRNNIPCELADLSTQGEEFMDPQNIFSVHTCKWKELEAEFYLSFKQLDAVDASDDLEELQECHSRVNLLLSEVDQRFVDDTDKFLEWFIQHKAISVVSFDNSSNNIKFLANEDFSTAWKQIDEIVIDYENNPMAIRSILTELAWGSVFKTIKKVQIPDITFGGDEFFTNVLKSIQTKYFIEFKNIK